MLPYVEPSELVRELRADRLPLESQILQRLSEDGVDCSEVRILSEIVEDEKIYMHAWLARPAGATRELPALLAIPGGLGRSDSDFVRWTARKCNVVALGVDWVGAGGSDLVPGFDAWEDAVLVPGEDYRSSYQFHNVRALFRATEFLLSQPDVDGKRLMASGGSWGGFYSWLLAGLDDRFTDIFPTYGCGFLDTEARQTWESDWASVDPEKVEEWLRAFDPGRRAHLIKAKVFYQQCTNDKYYSLLASMLTYRRVRTEKRILLVRNQDHMTRPYDAQDVTMVVAALEGTTANVVPELRGIRWIPGTNLVELDADGAGARLSVMWSGGTYTKSFARYWREVPAEVRKGKWIAEIPVVDPDRELWLYGHAVHGNPPLGLSTAVTRVVPSELGLLEPTAEFDPSFDFASDSFWDLPLGDRHHPAMRLDESDGLTALAMRFDGDSARRGIAYCLEGDLISAGGYNAIEVMVRVPEAKDVQGLELCLDTDFHALSEQVYGVPLERLGRDFGEWQTVTVPFADFEPHLPRTYYMYVPPLRPLDVSRLCGVGFYHADRTYAGEAMIGNIRAVRVPDAPVLQPPESGAVDPWPRRSAQLDDPDPLAAPDRPLESVDRPSAEQQPGGYDTAPEPAPEIGPYDFYIETPLSAEELRPLMKAWEPWRHEIFFSNGVRATEFQRAPRFFVDESLATWRLFEKHIDENAIRGGRCLDVGSNIGHYSIFLPQRYDMTVIGLETNPRNLEVAEFLRDTSGRDRVTFLNEDGATYVHPEPLDLILHFGTLDHLKNPFLALENSAAMLVPGGYLLLEFQTYKDPHDERICLFARPSRAEGTTCWWFLGKDAVLDMLDEAGFSEVNVVLEWGSPKIGDTMRRLHIVARK